MRCLSVCCSVGIVLLNSVYVSAGEVEVSAERIREAIRKAIPLLEAGSRGSADQRTCFTCHNQAIPVMALAEARAHGFAIDASNFQRQIEHTAAHLERGKEQYLQGKGQGGRAVTAGYALWGLEAGEYAPNDVTAAVTSYLLQTQKDSPFWSHPGRRPPSSGSNFTTSYVALRGLAVFGAPEQSAAVAERTELVKNWLLAEPAKDTEDRVFRLWSMDYFDGVDDHKKKAVQELVESQRPDGGWAQIEERASDAYATATVLVVLLETGALKADSPVVRRGVQFLLDAQLPDGSWHVQTRAEPFQLYYESGFPHGKDQFISIAASGWATIALLKTLPK